MQKLLTLVFGLLSIHLMAQNNWTLVSDISTQSKNYYGIYARPNGLLTLSSEWGRLFQSTDGGNTIDTYQIPGNFSIYQPILFTDDLHGFVGGGCWFPTQDCITGVMLTTKNGGADWQLEQISNQLGILNFISATNTGTVFTIGDYGSLFQYNPAFSQWDSIYQFAGGVNTGMQFVTDEKGFVMRNYYQNGQHKISLFKTTTGGTTWNELNSTQDLTSFYFLNENKGFISFETDTLYLTLDGGESLEPAHAFGGGGVISKIKFYDDAVGYAFVGFPNQLNHVYRTADGGQSWVLDFETTVSFQDISMVSKEEAYLLGNFNLIFHRTGMSAVNQALASEISKVWPNPAQNVLNIETETEGVFTVFATDGRPVLSQPISGNAQIKCADLPRGLYYYGMNGRVLGKICLIQ